MTVFIHSLLDGHLDCFQFSVITNVLLWTFVCKSLHGHTPSYLLPKSGMARSYGRRMFNFLGDCQMAFQSAIPCYAPNRGARVFQLLHTLAHACRVSLSYLLCSHTCAVVSHCMAWRLWREPCPGTLHTETLWNQGHRVNDWPAFANSWGNNEDGAKKSD